MAQVIEKLDWEFYDFYHPEAYRYELAGTVGKEGFDMILKICIKISKGDKVSSM